MSLFSSVRFRLTLWYLFFFGVLLAGFCAFTYFLIKKDIHDRLDNYLVKDSHHAIATMLSELKENPGNNRAAALEALSEMSLNSPIGIFSGTNLLASNFTENLDDVLVKEITDSAKKSNGQVVLSTRYAGKEEVRIASLLVEAEGKEFFVILAEPLESAREQIQPIKEIFAITLPSTLIIAALGGFLLAKKSLSPVVAMSNQVKHISANNLYERLTVKNRNDELGQLAETFNELLLRLNNSFENMKRFIADASHELRTPLTIIKGEIDVALLQAREPVEYQETLSIINDETVRLSKMVNDLLALASADAGQYKPKVELFYLNDLIESCYKTSKVLASRKHINLILSPLSETPFKGDEEMLKRLILNLLDNAIKYTLNEGTVTLKLINEAKKVKIVVSDNGVGIAEDSLKKIFERFYRVDKARSRSEGGSGLGLAIAKCIVEAHQGSIEVESLLNKGSKFIVSLPL